MAYPRVFVVSGPSGVGKTTIIKEVVRRTPGMRISVSMTTRPRRPGEIHGRDYFFVSREEFQQRAANLEFLEWALIYDNFYGTHRDHINQILSANTHALLDLDTQGAMQIKENCEGATFVFIKPPSLEELGTRLRGRGTETEANLYKRLSRAAHEMSFERQYDYVIVNQSVDQAVEEFLSIISREQNHAVKFVIPGTFGGGGGSGKPAKEQDVVAAVEQGFARDEILASLEQELKGTLGIEVTDWLRERMEHVLRRDLETIVRETYREFTGAR
ncbi:MAG TPA: guanylate kinase [bacterium]